MTPGGETARSLVLPAVWPLAGRRELLSEIERARREQGAAVVSGPVGSGRTRAAREAAHAAEADGAPVHWVSATRAARRSRFGAVAHLLPDGVSAEASTADVLRSVSSAVRSDGVRTVVVVDDAHHLDDDAAALVLHLVVTGAAFVLMTVRDDAQPPDAVRTLWKDGYGSRFPLGPLSDEEASRLLQQLLGAPLEPSSLHRLQKLTGGWPLYLREAVVQALQAGGLDLTEGLWRWDGTAVSQELRELARLRLAQLGETQRHLGEALGTGGQVPERVLHHLFDDTVLRRSQEQGMVVVSDDAELVARLASPIHAEVMRALLPTATRRAWAARLAAALTEVGPRGDREGLLLASWSVEAGLPVETHLLEASAATALRAREPDVALHLATAAVHQGAGVATVLTRAAALRMTGQADEAEADLADAEPAATGHQLAERYLRERCGGLIGALGRSDDALALLDRAQSWQAGREWLHVVTGLRLRPLLYRARFAEVVAQGLPLALDPTVATRVRALAAPIVGQALVKVGRLDEALECAELAMGLAAHPSDPASSPAIEAHRVRAAVQWARGEWLVGEPSIKELYDEGLRRADPALLGPSAYVLGSIAFACGGVDEASRLLREAVGHLRSTDGAGFLGPCLGRLARVEATGGRVGEADRYLAEARGLATARPDAWLLDIELVGADIWVLAASGATSAAVELALSTADRFREHQPGDEAEFLHEAMRLGAGAPRVATRLIEVAERVDSPLVRLFADHAAAAGDGAALERVAARFAALPARLLAAECALEAAHAHEAAGRASSARRARAASAALLARCVGASTPGTRATRASAGLTAREREVAALAAEGLSNAAIAARLVISERTVESHVLRACTKLGVHSRDDLRTALS